MKQRLLLFLVMTAFITTLQAQKKNKNDEKTITGYAITAMEKGGKSWKEVKLIDINSGAVLKNIFDSKQETQPLNARTGNAVVKKEQNNSRTYTATIIHPAADKKVVNLDQELDKASSNNIRTYTRTVVIREGGMGNSPFSGSSAAMAYDKKHERLYYTPMAINQLRYIDLKSGKVYYFEDEPFGVVKGMGDAPNQITRMVIASDGNGYALTNDANHLIRFTTGKNPAITDLGALADAADTKYSVHSRAGYGGDMVADASGNLYLLTANRNVFKVNIETKAVTYLGKITGLPQDFSTNGAMVEEGSKVIIASSQSTTGYYRFDLTTLAAEKVSGSADVFNASDLANGNLAFDKKKKDKKIKNEEPAEAKPEIKPDVTETKTQKGEQQEILTKNGIAVYPNPVTNGVVNLSFANQAPGRYQVQLLDLSGRVISSKEVNIGGDAQIETFKFPELSVSGSYLLRISSEVNKINVTNKIVVQ